MEWRLEVPDFKTVSYPSVLLLVRFLGKLSKSMKSDDFPLLSSHVLQAQNQCNQYSATCPRAAPQGLWGLSSCGGVCPLSHLDALSADLNHLWLPDWGPDFSLWKTHALDVCV